MSADTGTAPSVSPLMRIGRGKFAVTMLALVLLALLVVFGLLLGEQLFSVGTSNPWLTNSRSLASCRLR